MPAWAWDSSLLTPLTFTAYLFWKKNIFLRGLAFSDFLPRLDRVNAYFWGSGRRAAICKLLAGGIVTMVNTLILSMMAQSITYPQTQACFCKPLYGSQAWFSSSCCYHPLATGCHKHISAGKMDCGCMLAWGNVRQVSVNTWTCEKAALNWNGWFCLQQIKASLYFCSVHSAVVMLFFC